MVVELEEERVKVTGPWVVGYRERVRGSPVCTVAFSTSIWVLSYAAYSGIGLPLDESMRRPFGMSLFRAGMMRGSGEARVLKRSF